MPIICTRFKLLNVITRALVIEPSESDPFELVNGFT